MFFVLEPWAGAYPPPLACSVASAIQPDQFPGLRDDVVIIGAGPLHQIAYEGFVMRTWNTPFLPLYGSGVL